MKSMGKIMTFMMGVIVFGALAPTAFGYFSNITSALSDYSWASTIIVLGIIISAVYMFIPKKG